MRKISKRFFARIALMLLCVTGLNACATVPASYEIDCSGDSSDWKGCYSKADELCGAAGYDVLKKSGEHGSVVMQNRYGGAGVEKSVVVQCKSKS